MARTRPRNKPRKFDPSKKDVLVSPQRREDLDTYRVMALLTLLPYHVVADIGCGPGYFAVALGKHVFDGKVYALDVQQEMLDATKEELERVYLTNVELVLSQEEKLPLEDDSLDGAFAAFVVHEANAAKTLLQETLRCLHKGGWLAILEWHKREMEEGPPLEERIDELELWEMAQDVGFRFTSRHSLNNSQYMFLLRK